MVFSLKYSDSLSRCGSKTPIDICTIMARLLSFGGDSLRATVRELKRRGWKSEAAFASCLGLTGDPYTTLFALESLCESKITEIVEKRFRRNETHFIARGHRRGAMTKISIMYPNREGSRFDMNYYLHTHMPMSIERLSSAKGFRGVSVERGVSGTVPDSAPAYVADVSLSFRLRRGLPGSIHSSRCCTSGDMPNYTDVEPTIQVNEVAISR